MQLVPLSAVSLSKGALHALRTSMGSKDTCCPSGLGVLRAVLYLSDMKKLILCVLALAAFVSCGPAVSTGKTNTVTQTEEPPAMKTYSNERFRQVIVLRSGDGGSYRVSGQARVFEATLNYVVIRENQELLRGFATAGMGAPEWGDFSFEFTLDASSGQKPRLLLFEISAKDGTRTHVLDIPLP